MKIGSNVALATTGVTLAACTSLGVSVIREISGDAISNEINGVNIHTDSVLASTFAEILREELMFNPDTRIHI